MIGALKWIQIGVGAVGGFALCWLIHLVILSGVEAKQRAELTAQETRLHAECTVDKKITEEANAFYQQQVGDITVKLDKYRLYASKCVALSSDTPKLPASGGEPTGSGGLSVGFIRYIAAQGDTYRAQRMTCDKYFDALRK